MNFKKDKVFTAVVSVFVLVFLAGVGFCVKELIDISGTKTTIEKTEKSLKRLTNRGNAAALNEKNVATGEANQKKLDAAKAKKVARFKGSGSEKIAATFNGDAGEFISSLRGAVSKCEKELQGKKIVLDGEAKYFGFKRYLEKSQVPAIPADALPTLSVEQNVIQRLTDSLVSAREQSEKALRDNGLIAPDKNVFLLIKNVRREAAELPKKDGSSLAASLSKDELSVTADDNSAATGLYRIAFDGNSRGSAFPSLRRPGVTDALAFQVGFVAPTSVLRNFIAEFSDNEKYPIFVRDISVRVADNSDIDALKSALNPQPVAPAAAENAPAAEAAGDFDIFGGAPATSSDSPAAAPLVPAVPVKSVVLPETLSEFVVTLEYVVPVEKTVPAEEKEEE